MTYVKNNSNAGKFVRKYVTAPSVIKTYPQHYLLHCKYKNQLKLIFINYKARKFILFIQSAHLLL